jgi:acyl-CoA synthetase (NDP forming)
MNLQPLFEPRTMAVIGISLHNDRHPANVIYNKNNHRYPIRAYPINPKGGMLHDEIVYKHVSEVPEKIDFAVIAARAELVPDIMNDCIEAGVGAAAVISGGFAEVGRRDLQTLMADTARDVGFPFIGPNCLGLYIPSHMDTFFLPIERMVFPRDGNVAFVSQSGGILVDQMIKFRDEGVGLAKAISIGNKALIKEIDILTYLEDDPKTKVIVFYIEGFGKDEGRKFVQAAQTCHKPIIVLKSGKTPAGEQAVSSHTASLAGDYESFSAALIQYGVVVAENELELVAFCESLSAYEKPTGANIGIVTGSGGHGALAVDGCYKHSLMVPSLSQDLQTDIRKSLSQNIQAIASLGNPIDLTGSGTDDDFVSTVRLLSTRDDIDCIMVLLLPYLPGISTDLGARLSNIYKQTDKPIIAYVPHVEKYQMLIEGFQFNGVPVSPSIEGAVFMAKALRRNG